MKILVGYHRSDRYLAEIVVAAMHRSFTSGQIHPAPYGAPIGPCEGAVLIEPGAAQLDLLRHFRQRGRKVLVLGRLADRVAQDIGLRQTGPPRNLGAWNTNEACPIVLRYVQDHWLARRAPIKDRPLWRFDYGDEWNNLGFGRIALNGGAWSLAGTVEPDGATPLAALTGLNDEPLGLYAALSETSASAVLWYNRAVGPVDSLEWSMVESFFGEYRQEELSCWPVLAEVPAGFRGAVTMRLDCDEAVASARPLFELYQEAGVPFTLAVVTGLPMGQADLRLLRDTADRGAVVSHSVHHWSDWGGSYTAAWAEAMASRLWLEENLPGSRRVRFAVSPFHQNSVGACQALADAGYDGFVGGIIRNDPEFLLGRAGQAPLVSRLIAHSQQCMLHGDCCSTDLGQQIILSSFDNHLRGQAIFGYLDHPFSERYQYGWATESARLRVHAALLSRMRSEADIWWANLDQCLGFLCKRNATTLTLDSEKNLHVSGPEADDLPAVAVTWRGRSFAA